LLLHLFHLLLLTNASFMNHAHHVLDDLLMQLFQLLTK